MNNNNNAIPTAISGINDGKTKLLLNIFLLPFFFSVAVAAMNPMKVDIVADRMAILMLIRIAANTSLSFINFLNHFNDILLHSRFVPASLNEFTTTNTIGRYKIEKQIQNSSKLIKELFLVGFIYTYINLVTCEW